MNIEASKLRKRFATYIDMAHEGVDVVITKHGKPHVRLVAFDREKIQDDDVVVDFIGMWKKRKRSGVSVVNKLRTQNRFKK